MISAIFNGRPLVYNYMYIFLFYRKLIFECLFIFQNEQMCNLGTIEINFIHVYAYAAKQKF